MPNVDIVSLPVLVAQKDRLSPALTRVFCEKAGCGPAAVHLRYHEVAPENYAIKGAAVKTNGTQNAAVFEINVAWYAGRNAETQEAVAAGLTEAVSAELEIDPGTVEVNFSELRPENHFEGGKRAPQPKA